MQGDSTMNKPKPPGWLMILKMAFDYAVSMLSPDQQKMFRRGLILVGGLLVFLGGGGGFVMATGFTNIFDRSPVPGATADPVQVQVIEVVPRAPGTDPRFALDFCNDPVTKAEPPGPVDPERITLTRGTDTLSWTGVETAPAYYQPYNEQGKPVDMTPASVACFKRKAAR